MARPKKKVESKSKTHSMESIVSTSQSVEDRMEEAVLKEYQSLFASIPDRRLNLFKTNIPGLDYILGGGLPRGQMVHAYGPEGCGKTTLALHVTAAVQQQGGKVLYADAENSVDRGLALALGIQPDKTTYVNKIPSGEFVLDMIEKAIRASLYPLIVVDSVAALSPAETINGSNQDATIGVKARMLSKALEKLNNAAVNSDTIILFINQLRANIQTGYGVRPFTTPGGKALPFYANTNIYMQKIGPIKEGEVQIGQQVRIRVEKNKIAPPMRDVICNLVYGQGFRKDMDLILTAKDRGVIRLKGSWYEYNGEQIGQGLNSAVDYARSHPEFLTQLENTLYGASTSEANSVSPAVISGDSK